MRRFIELLYETITPYIPIHQRNSWPFLQWTIWCHFPIDGPQLLGRIGGPRDTDWAAYLRNYGMYSGICMYIFILQLYVHPKGQFPLVDQYGISLSPGFSTAVRTLVITVSIQTIEGNDHLPPQPPPKKIKQNRPTYSTFKMKIMYRNILISL